MSRPSREVKRLNAIRSVSLQDIVHGRHARWRRFVRRAATALTVVTLAGAAAAAGGAVFYAGSGPGESALLASTTPAPPKIVVPPQGEALPLEAYLGPPTAEPSQFELSPDIEDERAPVETAALETDGPLADEAPEAETDELARVPTPRPDEPIVTGSITPHARAAPQASREPVVEQHRFRPCRTLQRWTSRLPVLRVHCGS